MAAWVSCVAQPPPVDTPILFRNTGTVDVPVYEWKPYGPMHCATCQCERTNAPLPLDGAGNPRKRSWHHN